MGDIIKWSLTIFILVFCECIGAFYEPDTAIRSLTNFGFTDIKIDHDASGFLFVGLRGCGAGDVVKFSVHAKNPTGQPTQGLFVCVGLLKGAAPRTE